MPVLKQHLFDPWCDVASWCDPGLTPRGEREVEHAARLLLEGGYKIDVVQKTSSMTPCVVVVFVERDEQLDTIDAIPF